MSLQRHFCIFECHHCFNSFSSAVFRTYDYANPFIMTLSKECEAFLEADPSSAEYVLLISALVNASFFCTVLFNLVFYDRPRNFLRISPSLGTCILFIIGVSKITLAICILKLRPPTCPNACSSLECQQLDMGVWYGIMGIGIGLMSLFKGLSLYVDTYIIPTLDRAHRERMESEISKAVPLGEAE